MTRKELLALMAASLYPHMDTNESMVKPPEQLAVEIAENILDYLMSHRSA